MLDHHALGTPGRSRGVDHVGEIRRAHQRANRELEARIGIACVEYRHRHRRARTGNRRARCDHRQAARVRDDVGDALPRQRGLERQVGGARLEHREQGHGEFGAAPGEHRDDRVGLDRHQRAQAVGERVSAAVELGVGEALARGHHRDAIRHPGRAALEGVHQRIRRAGRGLRRCRAPDRRALGGGQNVDLVEPDAGAARDFFGHGEEVSLDGRDLRRLVAARGVGDAHLQVRRRHELDVEVVVRLLQVRHRLDREAQVGQPRLTGEPRVHRVVCERHQRAEEALLEAVRRLHARERRVLVRPGLAGLALHRVDQFVEGCGAIEVHAHRDGVDEVADDALHVGDLGRPAGDHGTEHHVVGVGVAPQQQRPDGVQHNRERRAAAGGELL